MINLIYIAIISAVQCIRTDKLYDIDGFQFEIAIEQEQSVNPTPLKWDLSPSQIVDQTVAAIESSKKALDALLAAPGPRTYANTVVPFARQEAVLGRATRSLSFFS